jgi:hypothetical protein
MMAAAIAVILCAAAIVWIAFVWVCLANRVFRLCVQTARTVDDDPLVPRLNNLRLAVVSARPAHAHFRSIGRDGDRESHEPE